jgi:hypothetical protein
MGGVVKSEPDHPWWPLGRWRQALSFGEPGGRHPVEAAL